jgi:YD repeat-containing protein
MGSGGTTVGEGDGGGPLLSSNPIPGVGIVVKRNPKKTTARSGGPIPPNSEWGGEYGASANMRSRLNELETVLHSTRRGFGGISVGADAFSDLASSAVDHGSSLGGGSDPGGDLLPGSPIGGLAIKGGRNPGGGMGGATGSRPGSPIGGLSIKGGRNPGGGSATRVVTSQGQEYHWSYDANGNCLSYRTPIAGGGCDFAYDALGRCTSTTVLNGPGSRFEESADYDASTGWKVGHLQDPAALQLTRTCQRDALGRIVRCVDERGSDGLTDYDALDRVTQTQSPPLGSGGSAARVACNYYYDAAGLLARFDVEQRDATGALDPANPLRSSFLVRDGRGRVVREAEEQRPVYCPTAPALLDPMPLGIENFATSDFSFDAAGQCVAVAVPALSRGQSSDEKTECSFDERGLPFRCAQGGFADPSAQVTQYDWDSCGACVRRAELSSSGAPDLVTTFAYDPFHRLASCTDPMGNVLTLERDAKDLVACRVTGELVDGDGSSGNTLLASARGRNGFAGGGGGGSYFFGVVVADDSWTASRFTPGAGGPPVAQTVTVHRSPAGLVTSVTNDHDTVLTVNYDSAGRALLVADGASSLDVTRDEAGNAVRTRRTDHFENGDIPTEDFTVTRTFDALGRCTSVTDAVGNHEAWQFDSFGRCTQYTDANGFVVQAHWDGAVAGGGTLRPCTLLLEGDVDGDGVADRLRDLLVASGELVSVTNSNGDTTAFTHDAQGRTVRRDDPDGTFEEWLGDDYGTLAKHKRKDGAIVSCDFDRDRRVASSAVAGAPGTVPVAPTTFHYDGLGRCVECDQGPQQLTFTYDSLGNQLSELRRGSGLVDAGVTRTFDAHGRSSVSYSSGQSYLEQRNAFGEIVTITPAAAGGASGGPPITTVEYVGHRVWRETRADGLVTKHDYRSDGEPPPLGSVDLSFDACVRTICLDANGAVVQATYTSRDATQDERELDAFFGGGPSAIGRKHEQTFDPLHRLLHSVISRRDLPGQPFVVESDVTYTRDLEGLRLTATGGGHPGVYVQNPLFPPADRQAGQYTKWPGGPLRWDDAGNLVKMTSGGATTRFVYDALSRLVAARDFATAATIATYEYDGLGRRISSTLPPANPSLPPSVTRFLYDGARCIEEIDGNGVANLVIVASESADHGLCIISRNGSLVYPHGGGPKDPLGSASDGARRTVTFTSSQGSSPPVVLDREDCDDGCAPIFLRANGRPRPGATGTLGGDDWVPMSSASDGLGRYCPETGFTQGLGATFSPQLGRDASADNVILGNVVGASAVMTTSSR